MYRDRIADRKIEVMLEAGRRYKNKAPEVAATAAKLATGGPLAAASESRRKQYLERETTKLFARVTDPMTRAELIRLSTEKILGPSIDWVDIPPPEARKAGRPVARIVELAGRSRIGDGFATGFVVPPGLLVTNWHVFDSPEDASSCGAQFGYENDDSGMPAQSVVFEIDPKAFFLSDKAHDVAIVGLSDRPVIGSGLLSNFGTVTLIPSLGKILVGQAVNIIQHPDGRHKHWALQKNTLYVEPKDDDLFLMYTTDTLEGSSGSPAFNKDWELVAVHHGGVPDVKNGNILTTSGGVWQKGMPETDIKWVANEGARVSKVYALLQSIQLNDASHQTLLNKLLAEAKDVVREEAVSRATEIAPKFPVQRSSDPVNITVHGTANFYLGGKATGGRMAEAAWPLAEVGEAPPEALNIRTDRGGANRSLTTESKLRFDPDYKGRVGYVSTFLEDHDVPPPEASRDDIYVGPEGLTVLKYHHYSLVMHRERRLAMWTAANVDYDETKRRFTRDEFGDDSWKPDPRIPIEAQLEDVEFYAPARKFDRGHIVRRDDSAWGADETEEVFANSDTFHWTNCTPQHEHFNRDMYQYRGLWGKLEHHIAMQARFVGNKLILFAGPVLSKDDESRDFGSGIEVKVPMAFWKVVVVAEKTVDGHQLRAYGFVLDQSDAIKNHGWEARFQAGEFSEQQVSLAAISDRCGVKFHKMLHDVDPLAGSPAESRGRSLRTLKSIRLE